MTRLEHIEIEGFKGIESLEFEPSGINLITGRNNTGKTSVLEAIELSQNPKKIRKFRNDIDSVIKKGRDTARARGIAAKSDREIIMRFALEKELKQYYSEFMFQNVILGSGFIEVSLAGIDHNTSISEQIQSVIQRAVAERVSKEDLHELQRNLLIISIGNNECPYVVLRRGSELLRQVNDELEAEFLSDERQETLKSVYQEELDRNDWLISFNSKEEKESVLSSITPKVNVLEPGEFLIEPEINTSINFIDSLDLREGLEKDQEEQDAIKIDDIGDYIKEHKLVDDLKTFDLDYLVFEDENGEKYQVPYDFMGDGFKAVVGLLWELLDDDIGEQIVLIEEPENHMHPGYIREVVYFLIHLARDENVQLFITTHDSDFINDFFNENLTDEEREFLEKEFTLIRMEEYGAMVVDYETAESDLKDLHLDLRGI